MKNLLIQDFTKFDSRKIEAFLQHHKLFNVHAIVPADAFTDQWLKLMNRFAINVVVPLDGVDDTHNGLFESEKRNPGLEARLLAAPASKLNILFQSSLEPGHGKAVALALSFPEVPVWMVRNPEGPCQYFDDMQLVRAFDANDAPLPNVQYRLDLRADFYPVSYETLTKSGIVGENECLVLVK